MAFIVADSGELGTATLFILLTFVAAVCPFGLLLSIIAVFWAVVFTWIGIGWLRSHGKNWRKGLRLAVKVVGIIALLGALAYGIVSAVAAFHPPGSKPDLPSPQFTHLWPSGLSESV